MSDECYLYGAILGVFGTTEDWYGPFEPNIGISEAGHGASEDAVAEAAAR